MTIDWKSCRLGLEWIAVHRLLLMLCLSSLIACSANYGRVKKDKGITEEFKAYQLQEGYDYYYYGWIDKPDVVIGLDPEYTLEDKNWKSVDFSMISLQTLIDQMWNKNKVPFYGAFILDPEGSRAGIWYSDITYASIKFDKGNRITSIYLFQDMPWDRVNDGY